MRDDLYVEAEAPCNNPYTENIWPVAFFRPLEEESPQQEVFYSDFPSYRRVLSGHITKFILCYGTDV
jgi:hypothetical protein